MPYTTLADLENDKTKSSKKLRQIAAELKLRIEYLETDEGEPEVTQAASSALPLSQGTRERLNRLTRTELELVDFKLRDILADIEADRQSNKKTG